MSMMFPDLLSAPACHGNVVSLPVSLTDVKGILPVPTFLYCVMLSAPLLVSSTISISEPLI